MFHQLRIRRKAVLTAARRKKYAKCDTLQCTGTWADPTGMNWSMLGVAVASYLESLHPHRRFWHAIRSFDNCSSSKFVIWRIPLSAQPTCWPVACLRWFRHSSKRNGYGYGGYGSKLSSHHPQKKKKTHITCVAPLLPKFDPKITVLWCHKSKPARLPSGWDWSDFVKCCWGCSVSCYQPQSAGPDQKPLQKKTRENHPHFEPESNWLMQRKTLYLDSIYWQNHLKVLFNWFQ